MSWFEHDLTSRLNGISPPSLWFTAEPAFVRSTFDSISMHASEHLMKAMSVGTCTSSIASASWYQGASLPSFTEPQCTGLEQHMAITTCVRGQYMTNCTAQARRVLSSFPDAPGSQQLLTTELHCSEYFPGVTAEEFTTAYAESFGLATTLLDAFYVYLCKLASRLCSDFPYAGRLHHP